MSDRSGSSYQSVKPKLQRQLTTVSKKAHSDGETRDPSPSSASTRERDYLSVFPPNLSSRSPRDASKRRASLADLFTKRKDAPDFKNPLEEDTNLIEFLAEVRSSIDTSVSDSDSDKFNKKLGKIESDIESEIEREKSVIQKVQKTADLEGKKAEVVNFQHRERAFLKAAREKFKQKKQDFLNDKQKELYGILKNIIIDSFWERQVTFCAGKTVVDRGGIKKNVPSGIEKMIRVIIDDPQPSSMFCFNFCFLCKPVPASRHHASSKIELTPAEVADKIQQIKAVADIESKEEPTESKSQLQLFYAKLKEIDPTQLSDRKTIKKYIQLMTAFYGPILTNNFINDNDNDGEDPEVRPALRIITTPVASR